MYKYFPGQVSEEKFGPHGLNYVCYVVILLNSSFEDEFAKHDLMMEDFKIEHVLVF